MASTMVNQVSETETVAIDPKR
jgi:hypothetical protein